MDFDILEAIGLSRKRDFLMGGFCKERVFFFTYYVDNIKNKWMVINKKM